MSYTVKEIWTTGRRGGIACVQAYVYQNQVVASAEPARITENQMGKALEAEFPGYAFKVSQRRGDGLFMEGTPCMN